jgi:hypothetical protein
MRTSQTAAPERRTGQFPQSYSSSATADHHLLLQRQKIHCTAMSSVIYCILLSKRRIPHRTFKKFLEFAGIINTKFAGIIPLV